MAKFYGTYVPIVRPRMWNRWNRNEFPVGWVGVDKDWRPINGVTTTTMGRQRLYWIEDFRGPFRILMADPGSQWSWGLGNLTP